MLKFLLINCLLTYTVLGQATEECRTPFSEAGSCVAIRECSSIWRIVTEAPRPLNQRVLQFLQNSVCGSPSERRVCCRLQDISGASPSTAVQQPVTPSTPIETPTDEIANHPSLRFLDLKTCGPISSDRIAHGNETVLYEFPWMALLGYEDSGGLDFKCGGSVINKRYVLTGNYLLICKLCLKQVNIFSAAHCVTNLRSGTRLRTVRLGEYDISKETDCMQLGRETVCTPAVQDIDVERAFSHPGFNRPKWANDIAMIRLARDADFSEFAVAPICLPITKSLMQITLKNLTVTGWGTTEAQHKSDRLLKIDIPFVQRAPCEQTLKVNLNDGQFCAGGRGMADSCGGKKFQRLLQNFCCPFICLSRRF